MTFARVSPQVTLTRRCLPGVTLAEVLPEGARLTLNILKADEGLVTVLIDSPTQFIIGHAKRLMTVNFDLAKDAPLGNTAVTTAEPRAFPKPSRASLMQELLGAVYKDGRHNHN